MKWYNQNGLKILYDAEYSGDYLTGRKFGLYTGASDKIRGDYETEVDTANPNSPDSRIDCRTLEFFVVFEAPDYDDDGLSDHALFNSSGDIDDDDQVGYNSLYKWYLKSEEYSSQYVFANYPLLLFDNFSQQQSTDYCPIAISFIKKPSSQWDTQNDPPLWIRVLIDSIYLNDGCNVGYGAFQLGGPSYRYEFIGRISEEENDDYEIYSSIPYYEDMSNRFVSGAQIFDDDMDECDFDMSTDTYAITNKTYPDFSSTATTFRGMTITITTEEAEDEDEYPVVKLIIYCNGRIIYKHGLPTSQYQLSNYGYMSLPRYITNSTISERYGDWHFAIEKDTKICQPLFVRAYDRALTPTEIQNNTDVDRQRFIGDMNMGWVTGNPPPEGFPEEEENNNETNW